MSDRLFHVGSALAGGLFGFAGRRKNNRSAKADAAWVLCALLALTSIAGAATSIEKVVAFPTADSVRVQVFVKSEQPGLTLTISGEISSLPEGEALWKGELGKGAVEKVAGRDFTISNLKPRLWSPITPALYLLKVTVSEEGKAVAEKSVRIGFRSFAARDGHFYLNGKPIFLRGIAINPPGRTIPPEVGESKQFAHDYVKFLRSQNVNIIRLDHDSQAWFDACDELGMMLYQGFYGAPPSGGKAKAGAGADDDFEDATGLSTAAHGARRGSSKDHPPADFARSVGAYEETFQSYANHPSIVIYVLSNELPYTGARGAAWHEFLDKAYNALRKWDPSRAFIGNAGYGQGHEGNVNDVHRYWGWYYNSFLTFYNLRNPRLFGDYEKNQPLTFSECVGNFTAPTGEYNLIERKQLAAALGWCGWVKDQAACANEHQCTVLKNVAESFRRMRPINERISGLMPFTILFDNWQGIKSFADMGAKPAMRQMVTSYQPVLASWELWTGQVYAGSTIHPIIHIINDAEDFSDLAGAELIYSIKGGRGEELLKSTIAVPAIAYYGTWSKKLAIALPANLATGDYTLEARVMKGDREVSRNSAPLFAGGSEWKSVASKPAMQVTVFDPDGRTAKAIERLGISVTATKNVSALDPRATALVIGENTASMPAPRDLSTFLMHGGRILCLAQDPKKLSQEWLPSKVEFFEASANDSTYPPAHRPTRDQSNLNIQRPGYPIFDGVDQERLKLWSDYTDWDQTKAGFPQIYPVTHGFKLTDEKALATTAILIDYDRGLEGVAVAELFDGPGSVVLSGLDLVSRAGLDPVADRMLRNLVMYVANDQPHEAHPEVTGPIVWGNYPTQQGVLAGPMQGLLINVQWIAPKLAPNAKPLSREQGAWNTKPSDQFVPRGIRVVGPYSYSTSTVPRELDRTSKTGSGFFWARVPGEKSSVVNKVENPTNDEQTISVDAGAGASAAVKVSAHQTLTIKTKLPRDSKDVCVRYTAGKELVILETSFQ